MIVSTDFYSTSSYAFRIKSNVLCSYVYPLEGFDISNTHRIRRSGLASKTASGRTSRSFAPTTCPQILNIDHFIPTIRTTTTFGR